MSIPAPVLTRCYNSLSLPLYCTADLIADAVMLRFTRKHPTFVGLRDRQQHRFWEFLALCGAGEGAEVDVGMLHDWGKILGRIEVRCWHVVP